MFGAAAERSATELEPPAQSAKEVRRARWRSPLPVVTVGSNRPVAVAWQWPGSGSPVSGRRRPVQDREPREPSAAAQLAQPARRAPSAPPPRKARSPPTASQYRLHEKSPGFGQNYASTYENTRCNYVVLSESWKNVYKYLEK